MMRTQSKQKQRGAVLVMALVMLTILTLIGVSSMESANIELKVAANAQEHEVAFQAAQTIIAYLTSGDPFLDDKVDFHDISGTDQSVSYPVTGSDAESTITDISGAATISYVGCSAGVGDSLEAGKGTKFNFYDMTVIGYNKGDPANASSNSVQVQGVRYFAAGCG